MSDPFAALRVPGVVPYIAGRTFAAFGRQMLSVAIGWELYERTNSPLALGLVGLVQVVPVLLLALPAGAAVDRYDRRRVAIASQLVLVGCAAAIAAVSFVHGPLWIVYALLAVHGGGIAFLAPASSALLPGIVPIEHFVNANAWRSSTFQLASMAGPAAAGFVLASGGGAPLCYALASALGIAFLAGLWRMPPPRYLTQVAPGARSGTREGLRFLFRTRLLLAAITLDLFAVLLGGATALLPIFARDILRVGPEGLGWLRAAPAAGALVMALVTTRLPPWRRPGQVLLIVVAGYGLFTLGFGLSTSYALSLVCLGATGILDNISVVIRATLEQMVTPDHLRGRVGAVHYVFISLSNELGEAESGVAAALLGPVGAVVLGGVGTLVVVAVAIFLWPELTRVGPLNELRPQQT